MEFERFVPDHLLEDFFGWLEVVPAPIEGLFAFGLYLFVVQAFEVRVLQALFYCVPLFGIEDEHLAQQVQSHWVSFRVKTGPTLLISFWQFSNVFSREVVPNKCHVFVRRRSQNSDCSLNLIQVVVSREEGSPSQKFSENAANGPNIEGISVVGCIEYDLGCSVPSSDDVFSESRSGLFVAASETEVTDLEVAVLVEQQVARLEISMDDVRGVDVKAASEQLIHEVLAVVVRQVLSRVDHSVHVCLHQVRNDVDILVACLGWWLLHVYQPNDVLMIEEF